MNLKKVAKQNTLVRTCKKKTLYPGSYRDSQSHQLYDKYPKRRRYTDLLCLYKTSQKLR